MNNNLNKRKTIINSDCDLSSFIGNELTTPSFIDVSLTKNIELKKENNIIQNINQKEKEIFRLYYNRLGRNFLNEKPKSLVLFEKRLKKYLFSPESKILEKFPSLHQRIKNETNKIDTIGFNNKIDMGQMMYYSLNNKNNKNDIFIANNKEKYLETSKNFLFSPIKDVVNSEFYKVKYLDKNYKRLGKILSNKSIKKLNNKDYSITLQNKSLSKINSANQKNKIQNIDNNSSEGDKYNSKEEYFNDINENDSFFLAKKTSYENNKEYNNTNCSDNSKNKKIIFWNYHKRNNILAKNLTERKSRNIRKNIKSVSEKLIKSPKPNLYKTNDFERKITTSLNISRTNRNIFSRFHKNSLNIDPNINHAKIKLLKTYNKNKNINLSLIKCKSRNVINIDQIKKKSSTYKSSIDNNIDNLGKYTKSCNSLLLKLIRKNKSKKRKYTKTYFNSEDKELKQILSSKTKAKSSNYMKNKIKEEKLKKMKVLINDTFLDYDINKILKDKTIHEKTYRKEDIFTKYSMISENLVFGEIQDIKNPKDHGLITDKDKKKLIMNKRMEKLREELKRNSHTINKLHNFIQIDKDKIMNIIKKRKNEKANL